VKFIYIVGPASGQLLSVLLRVPNGVFQSIFSELPYRYKEEQQNLISKRNSKGLLYLLIWIRYKYYVLSDNPEFTF